MTVRETSIETYNKIKADGLLSKRRMEVYSTLFDFGPLTATEIADKIPNDKSPSVGFNIHARLCELRQMGAVAEFGEKICSISNNNVILWDVTDKIPNKFQPEKKTSRKHLEKCREILIKVWKRKDLPLEIKNFLQEEFKK